MGGWCLILCVIECVLNRMCSLGLFSGRRNGWFVGWVDSLI